MWKLKENAGGLSKDENAKSIADKISRLRGITPGILALEIGVDLNKGAQAYDLVLYSEFESMDALNLYQNHPDHAKARDFILEVTSDRRVVDYEI